MKPNGSRARAALLLIWIIFGLNALSLISSWMQYNLIQDVVAGVYVSESDIAWNDMRQYLLGFIYAGAYIISIITFIRWFRRAYSNLDRTAYNTSYGEGWAAGAWFVPFLNWFMPYKIMRELYQGSRFEIPDDAAKEALLKGARNLPFWWFFWIANNILGQVLFNFSRGVQDVNTLQTSTTLSMVVHAIGLVLCLLTVLVIRNYARVEHLLVAEEPNYYEDYSLTKQAAFLPAEGDTDAPLQETF